MKYKNKLTGIVVNTDNAMGPEWEQVTAKAEKPEPKADTKKPAAKKATKKDVKK